MSRGRTVRKLERIIKTGVTEGIRQAAQVKLDKLLAPELVPDTPKKMTALEALQLERAQAALVEQKRVDDAAKREQSEKARLAREEYHRQLYSPEAFAQRRAAAQAANPDDEIDAYAKQVGTHIAPDRPSLLQPKPSELRTPNYGAIVHWKPEPIEEVVPPPKPSAPLMTTDERTKFEQDTAALEQKLAATKLKYGIA